MERIVVTYPLCRCSSVVADSGHTENVSSDYLSPSFLAIAHRGGATYAPNVGHENTVAAFETALRLGYRYLETDVHATSDGVAVAFHDERLDRVTNASGAISELTYAQLRDVRVGGDHEVPRVDELLTAFPQARFNLDIKVPGAVAPLADVLMRTHAEDRVLVTSFSDRRLRDFRARMDRPVTLGAGTTVIARQLLAFRMGVDRSFSAAGALQVPAGAGPIAIVTRRFVDGAHRAGLKVHVWTVDDPTQIGDLIDLGVDGIISDRIDVLKAVLVDRGMWE